MTESLSDYSHVLTNDLTPPKVLASAADGVEKLIAREHGDVDSIFGSAGVRVDDLDSPINELILSQFCELFEIAARDTGNDNFGLDFGDGFLPKQLGPIGYAAISSPTLSAAITNLIRYFPAHQEKSTLCIIPDKDVLWLSYRIDDPRIVNRRQDAELSLCMFRNIFRTALGEDWQPLEVRFEHDRPENWDQHETIFGAPAKFNRRTNAFAFRRKDLDARMPTQDSYLFAIITPFLESRCRLAENPEDFATMVRNQIKMFLGDKLPTVAEIAHVLGISSENFHRRLKQQGLLFPDLLRAARQELALHYLNDSNLSLTEIAYDLGYSELSAFSRAFRNWTGMSPQRYRRTR